jgi:hypothetical protein
VAIIDDANNTSVYVDGIYKGGVSQSFDYSSLPNDSILRLGAILHGGTAGYQYLKGALDDFGIWNSALTASQVNALYNLANYPAFGYDLGKVQQLLEVHGGGVSSEPVAIGSRTWNYTTGLTTDPARLGKVFVVDGQYTVALDGTGAGVASDLPSNMVAYWRFNETSGTTAADSSPSGLDGTLTGASGNLPTWIDGKFGGALRFGGGATGEHVEIGSDNVVTSLSGPKTFSFWTRVSSDSTANGFLTIDNGTSSNRWYIDDQGNAGDLRMFQVGGGSTTEVFRVEKVLNYNSTEWQHVLVTDDGTGAGGTRVFVDGQLAGTRDSFDYSGLLPGSVLRLGVARHSGSYQYFRGDLDDFGVLSAVLTTPQGKAVYSLGNHRVLGNDLGQVHQLLEVHGAGGGSEMVGGRQWSYTTGLSTDLADLGRVVVVDGKYTVALDASGAGVSTQHNLIAYWRFDESSGTTAIDSSASGLDGTLKGTGGNLPTRIVGKFGGALDFGGSGNRHVEIGSDNIVTQLSGETTVAFWAKLPETTSGSNGFISIGKDSNNRWYIDDDNRNGRVRVWHVEPDVSTGLSFQTASGVLAYGQDVWQHVVLSDDGQNTRVYVDGVLRGTYAAFDYSGLPNDSVLRLGARFVSSIESMQGALDDFGIWNTALTAPQAAALYSLGNTADINHNLGQVQELFDAYNAREGRSVRHGSLQWNYATGLPTTAATLGQVAKADGRYTVALDDTGAGFVANAELIAHWRFDEASGTVAYDSAGTNDGTLQGGGSLPTRVEGKFGNALRFGGGGSGQQVVIGADNVITDLSGPKTFSFWTKLESGNSSNHGFIGIDKDTSNRWYVDTGSSSVGNIRMWEGATDGEIFRVNNVLQNDQWQHVVIRDDGNATSVYVDGIYKGGANESFDYSNLPNDSILRLGAVLHGGTAGYQYLKGSLDDFGVWRVALSDPQIKALYNVAQHADLGYDLGQAQQLFNLHHDQRGGTRLNGRYWVYGTGLSTALDDLGQVLQDGHKYSLSLAGDGTGVFAPGKLIAHWAFDDGAGSVATDSVGNLHGTLVGSSGSTGQWIADGPLGGALQLDSSRNQYVLVGSDNVVTNLPGEKTIAFWTRVEQGSSTSNGFISIDNATSANRWYLDTTAAAATHIRAYKVVDGAASELFRVENVFEFGAWQHVVVTDDGTGSGGVKVFVDGELVGTRNSFEFADLLPTSVLRLGAARHSGSLQYLEGALDDFGIWSVALTAPQVAGLYQFALDPALGYDLGMMQQLFDHHELGPGGGELSLDGFWRWEFTDGLDTGLGLLTEQSGRYFFQLDAAGTGLTAIPEPGTFALAALALIVLLPFRRRRS